MNIIFFFNGKFGINSLNSLFNANHNIFELNNADIPIFLDGLQILEIKYSSKLPIYLKKILLQKKNTIKNVKKF